MPSKSIRGDDFYAQLKNSELCGTIELQGIRMAKMERSINKSQEEQDDFRNSVAQVTSEYLV